MAATNNGSGTLLRWLLIGGAVLSLLAPVAFGGYWLSALQGKQDAQNNVQTAQAAAVQQLSRHDERQDGQISTLTSEIVRISGQLTEVETQLNCQNIQRNDMKDWQDQINGLLATGALKMPPGTSWPKLQSYPLCAPSTFRIDK